MDDHPRLESEAEALARFRAAFGTPEEMFALGLASVCAIMDAEERGETTASPSEFLARHPEVVPVIARKAREAAAEFHARPVPVRPPIVRRMIRCAPRRLAVRSHRRAARALQKTGTDDDGPEPDPAARLGFFPDNLSPVAAAVVVVYLAASLVGFAVGSALALVLP